MLGAIILTAIRAMWLYALDFPRFLRRDIFDGLIWLAIFLTTSLVNVDIGLVVGIVLNLLLALYRGFRFDIAKSQTHTNKT